MTPESVMSMAHQAMYVALLLAAPLLLVALVVGLVVSLFQAATQINESRRCRSFRSCSRSRSRS